MSDRTFPPDQVAAVRQAVDRQHFRAHPYMDGGGRDEEIQQIVLGILNGKGSAQSGPAEGFLETLRSGRAENYPLGEEMTPVQQAQFRDYPGPGWTQKEFDALSPDDQKYKLAPGEYWDKQHGRDERLLDTFFNAQQNRQQEEQDAANSWFPGPAAWANATDDPNGVTVTSHAEKIANDDRKDAMEWYRRSDQATHWGKPASLETLAGLINPSSSIPIDDGAMYPEDSTWERGVAAPLHALDRGDGVFGTLFNWANTTSNALQDTMQGHAGGSLGRAAQAAYLNGKLNRVSPILPTDDYQSAEDRIRALRQTQAIRDDLQPMDTATSQYLHAGTPQSKLASIGKNALYGMFDATLPVSVGLGAARNASKVAGALKGGAAEGMQEAAESVPFSLPEVMANFSQLGSPDMPDLPENMSAEDRQAALNQYVQKQRAAQNAAAQLNYSK